MSLAARLRAVAEEVRRATAEDADASPDPSHGMAPDLLDPAVHHPELPYPLAPETVDLRELAEAVLELVPELLRIQGVE